MFSYFKVFFSYLIGNFLIINNVKYVLYLVLCLLWEFYNWLTYTLLVVHAEPLIFKISFLYEVSSS